MYLLLILHLPLILSQFQRLPGTQGAADAHRARRSVSGVRRQPLCGGGDVGLRPQPLLRCGPPVGRLPGSQRGEEVVARPQTSDPRRDAGSGRRQGVTSGEAASIAAGAARHCPESNEGSTRTGPRRAPFPDGSPFGDEPVRCVVPGRRPEWTEKPGVPLQRLLGTCS